MQLDESINREHLKEKFEKEKTEASAIVQRARAKLSGKFAEHAGKELVEAERAKVEENECKIQKLESYIASL